MSLQLFRRLCQATILALIVLLAGCSHPKHLDFKGTDISGADFGHHLSLTDFNGVHRTLADFRGKLVVLYFGYTHCPVVCPTTLAHMASAMRLLKPAEAKQIQVLFVTVDPERDTATVLKQYVPYFYPTFLGLYGTPAETAKAAKEFRIKYRKVPETGGGYTVDHTAGGYVLDRNGHIRVYQPYGQSPADIAHDLRLLLQS